MIKVCILGHKGMLGHMVKKYLERKNLEIITFDSRWPENLIKDLDFFECDFLINCIGAIPQKYSNFQVNYELPSWLLQHVRCKVIQPGTDIEDETPYSLSKIKACNLIDSNNNYKVINCSIIGPEINSKKNFFEWFLNSEDEIVGYVDYKWAGITTLCWAEICWQLILNWEGFEKEIIPITNEITKYDLLVLINHIYGLNKKVIPGYFKKNIKKNPGNVNVETLEAQLKKMKNFYYN